MENTIVWSLLFLVSIHGVKCQQLTQPASVTVQPGQRLTITCQVSYSVSDYWTAWIRQPAGKGLEWIGSALVGYTTYYKDSLKNKFSIDLDSSSNTATLNGQNMQPEDTAVYYLSENLQHEATRGGALRPLMISDQFTEKCQSLHILYTHIGVEIMFHMNHKMRKLLLSVMC
uniref:Immunoglobulin V-set domain-containing protein n=1 Tax=Mastacembelus armatus TaxID=205130 RepID=A0A7N8Y432_9TELE